jgi:D-cysteine desulfhydrase family pyridoxal phosphate-dependent enzyme
LDVPGRLEQTPHLDLAEYPTLLEALPRLSTRAGRLLFIKRDDEIGPGMGGNKTRKLEYLLADALKRKKSKVVTFGGLQSNHARITAAAARRLGLEPHLFYFERRPPRPSGNLLLNKLLGAHMYFIPFGGGGQMTLEDTIRLVRMIAWARVGSHYFIPVGGHHALGCLGYVRAALEIDEQARSLGLERAWLVLAAGSGGTLAGLMAGFWLAQSSLSLLGIDVGRLWKAFPVSIARLASELCGRLGCPHTFLPEHVPLIESRYVGPGYARPSEEAQEAIRTLASYEGILLDPVYTGKAFAGLLDLIRRQALGKDEPVIFLHTGGAPALFVHSSPFL